MKKRGNCVTTEPMMAAAVARALACGQTESHKEKWRCFLSAVISNLTLILVHCDLGPELEAISEEVEELAEEAERQS